MTDQLEVDFEARNKVLEKHQQKALVRWLEWEIWRKGSWLEKDGDGEFAPKSANDARQILADHGIEVKEKRLFGALFHPKRWEQDGWTNVKGPGHARKIQTFRPKPHAVFEPVAKPF